jgi:4a-hydroxytetrahydrobiopterin dehydratase
MDKLTTQKCSACRKGAPTVTPEEIAQLMPQLHADWKITDHTGVPQLVRVIELKNFVQAMELAQSVGNIAEEQGHHPVLIVEWGRLTVVWWTHAIANLHRNDFIMAAKTDRAVAQLQDTAREAAGYED